jgi:L,D-peptidoglycan transpeptidase YkuD (ErfK/YbiS/YcfS/YnhG family)
LQFSDVLGVCAEIVIFAAGFEIETMLGTIRVQRKPAAKTRGWLIAGAQAVPVALGRGGIKANKREGDGATPRGAF